MKIMNNSNLKTQVKSALGHNGFPGSPLFCQYGIDYGLVGMLTNQESGSNAGNDETKLKTGFSPKCGLG